MRSLRRLAMGLGGVALLGLAVPALTAGPADAGIIVTLGKLTVDLDGVAVGEDEAEDDASETGSEGDASGATKRHGLGGGHAVAPLPGHTSIVGCIVLGPLTYCESEEAAKRDAQRSADGEDDEVTKKKGKGGSVGASAGGGLDDAAIPGEDDDEIVVMGCQGGGGAGLSWLFMLPMLGLWGLRRGHRGGLTAS